MSKTTALFVLAALSFGFLNPALSDADVLDDSIFSIEAQALDGGSSVSFNVALNNAVVDGSSLVWELVEEVALADLGVLHEARITYTNHSAVAGSRGGITAQSVAVNFLVSSGAAGASFTVTSAPLAFETFNAFGRATAGATVTDNGSDGPGLLGNFTDNSAFRAFYNDTGGAGTGSTFATLVPGISGGPGSTVISFGNFPDEVVTFSPVNENGASLGVVSSMSSQWKFGVGPNNSAAGTSRFELVPEPGSCFLWIFGASLLMLTRRR